MKKRYWGLALCAALCGNAVGLLLEQRYCFGGAGAIAEKKSMILLRKRQKRQRNPRIPQNRKRRK